MCSFISILFYLCIFLTRGRKYLPVRVWWGEGQTYSLKRGELLIPLSGMLMLVGKSRHTFDASPHITPPGAAQQGTFTFNPIQFPPLQNYNDNDYN